jgi:hypothetical protein
MRLAISLAGLASDTPITDTGDPIDRARARADLAYWQLDDEFDRLAEDAYAFVPHVLGTAAHPLARIARRWPTGRCRKNTSASLCDESEITY